jgi:hypothetical protein
VSSVINTLYFLTIPLVSVMRFAYTSKGISKKFWVRVIIRCALSIEKYGISLQSTSMEVTRQQPAWMYRYINICLFKDHTPHTLTGADAITRVISKYICLYRALL